MKIISVFLLFLCILVTSCAGTSQEKTMQQVIDEAFSTSAKQYMQMAEKLAASDSLLPRTFDGKQLITSDSRWWCSGFFPGSLWYLYEYTQDSCLLAYARQYTARIEQEKYTTDNHDVGFILFCSFGNGLRLTGDPAYCEVLHTASQSLATRYNPAVGLIRSWDFNDDIWQYPVIIDNMMNLEMLLWTAKAFNEPQLRDISISHADKTMQYHYRDDYSSYHVVSYDTLTGQPHVRQTHQGYANESAWSRGQAWAIYGYAVCYRETKDRKYLDQALKTFTMMKNLKNMPEDLIPYWDMSAPNIPNEPRDVSTASCIASALYEISTMDVPDAAGYKMYADSIMVSLSSPAYRAALGTNGNFLLMHSVGSIPHNSEIDVPLNYADYYYLEALKRKRDIEKGL